MCQLTTGSGLHQLQGLHLEWLDITTEALIYGYLYHSCTT